METKTEQPDVERDELEETPDLDINSILTIHRENDGYIGFARKAEAVKYDKRGKPYQFENLFSIKTSELRSMFPSIRNWLTHDSYMTINSPYRSAPWKNKLTGLPDVWRSCRIDDPKPVNHYRFLTACYSDIDCGRPESDDPMEQKDWREAQHSVERLMDDGIIPNVSLMARSGRGVYLFWLLNDEHKPEELPRAYPEKIQLYKQINKALDERLIQNKLPADLKAHDVSRVLRVPGSIHRKAKRRVRYVVELDDNGKGFVYTLSQLAQFLGLSATATALPESSRVFAQPVQYRKTISKGSAPNRSLGKERMNALRCDDLVTIEQWRGGFLRRGKKYLEDGHTSNGRRFILSLYATFLRGCVPDQEKALDAIRTMASNCKPPYPSDKDDSPVEEIVEQAYKTPRKWSSKTLCKCLGITAEVARTLELKTIIPDELRQEREAQLPTQKDIILNRRQFIGDFISKTGITTSRKIERVCKANGFKTNKTTANQDLNALGFVTHRSRGGRPPKEDSSKV